MSGSAAVALALKPIVWLDGGGRATASSDLLLTECFGGEVRFTNCRVVCIVLMLGSVEFAGPIGAGISPERGSFWEPSGT